MDIIRTVYIINIFFLMQYWSWNTLIQNGIINTYCSNFFSNTSIIYNCIVIPEINLLLIFHEYIISLIFNSLQIYLSLII